MQKVNDTTMNKQNHTENTIWNTEFCVLIKINENTYIFYCFFLEKSNVFLLILTRTLLKTIF